GGDLGQQYDPFIVNRAAKLPIYTNVGVDTGRQTEGEFFQLPAGLSQKRLLDRRTLLQDLDRLRARIEHSPAIDVMDRHTRAAVELLAGPRAQQTFDLSRERLRSATDTANTSGASRPSW